METLEWYQICSKLTIKTPERAPWDRSGIFIVNFEHISHGMLTHSVHPPPFSAGGRAEGGVEPPTKFLKWGGGLNRTSVFRVGCWEIGEWLFSGGLQFFDKNKLKSGIFNDEKSLQTRILCSVVTKNSNWEVLSKNLVTFKRWGEGWKTLIFLQFMEKSEF